MVTPFSVDTNSCGSSGSKNGQRSSIGDAADAAPIKTSSVMKTTANLSIGMYQGAPL
jgi:hypothetical protein